jgi:hypothetical protein
MGNGFGRESSRLTVWVQDKIVFFLNIKILNKLTLKAAFLKVTTRYFEVSRDSTVIDYKWLVALAFTLKTFKDNMYGTRE